MGRTSKWGIEFGCILRQSKEGRSKNWLPNGMVPTLLWSRPALSSTVSNLLVLHTKVVHRNRLKPVFGTPELASCGSKPLRATPSRTFPAPNCGCPTYADVVKDSISSSELSAGSTTACEETASPLTQLVDDHSTCQEISSSTHPQRNRQPPERYGAPIIY